MTPQAWNDGDEEKPAIQEYECRFWEVLRVKGKIIRQKIKKSHKKSLDWVRSF